MPFPLALPFLFKGAVVVAKMLSAKGATAAVVKGAAITVKTVGIKTSIAIATTGLMGIGALQFTYEKFLKAKSIVRDFDNGDLGAAATGLGSLVASFGNIHNSFLDDAHQWIDAGRNVNSPEFSRLVNDVKGLIDDIVETGRTPLPE